MARSHAGPAFPPFARYGNNVIVTGDDQDSTTNSYLHAALLRRAKMEGFSNTIEDNAERINDEIRRSRRALVLLVGKARSTLRALNVELHDEVAERASPIELPSGSLEHAGAAFSAAPEIG